MVYFAAMALLKMLIVKINKKPFFVLVMIYNLLNIQINLAIRHTSAT